MATVCAGCVLGEQETFSRLQVMFLENKDQILVLNALLCSRSLGSSVSTAVRGGTRLTTLSGRTSSSGRIKWTNLLKWTNKVDGPLKVDECWLRGRGGVSPFDLSHVHLQKSLVSINQTRKNKSVKHVRSRFKNNYFAEL